MPEGASRKVLQLGGLCGLLAGALIIAGLLLALTIPSAVLTNVESFFQSSAETKSAVLTAGRIGYVAPLFYIPLLVALYQRVKKPKRTAALLGLVLGLAASATIVIYFHALLNMLFTLADRYANATPNEQTSVVIAGLAASGLLSGVLVAGIQLLGLSFIFLGVSALGTPADQRVLGWLGVVLGVATVAVALPFVPVSELFSFPIWALFSLVFGGWSVLSAKSRRA